MNDKDARQKMFVIQSDLKWMWVPAVSDEEEGRNMGWIRLWVDALNSKFRKLYEATADEEE